MNRSRISLVAGIAAALSFAGVAGCHEEGPAEKAGRAIDEAAENVQEGADDLANQAGEAADQAIDKAKEATKEATD
ncbi:MAG TPA: YtxH domain-containing protein [Myxococcota bacterium]|nr:YtxH domain-containing protein [Myxococcota bacterium]